MTILQTFQACCCIFEVFALLRHKSEKQHIQDESLQATASCEAEYTKAGKA